MIQTKVSIVIPCYNEVNFIDHLMANILSQDYPQNQIEILIADGNSTDGTRQKLDVWASKISALRILPNEKRFVSQGLNKCIRSSTGQVILRLDVHANYPANYISRLVFELYSRKAQNTGGVCTTEIGADTDEARAIAIALSHPFGIGNATFRIGANSPIEVDTVPFGCFNREIFDRIGYYDEDLIRNQDDELNGRILKNGGKIFLIPDVKIRYYARPTRKKLANMYYQYGFFKPLVNIKLGTPATLRQFAPPAMVFSFFLLLLFAFFSKTFQSVLLLGLCTYTILVVVVSGTLAKNKSGIFKQLVLTFPTLHFSYGWGYLRGIWDFTLLHKHTLGKFESIRQTR